jgi:hypothetical protein
MFYLWFVLVLVLVQWYYSHSFISDLCKHLTSDYFDKLLYFIHISNSPMMFVLNISSLICISISATKFVLKLSSLNYISNCGVVIVLNLLSSHRKVLYSWSSAMHRTEYFFETLVFWSSCVFLSRGKFCITLCVISYMYKPHPQYIEKSTD